MCRYPFQLLVNKLNLPRDPSRSPIFQTFFVLEKGYSSGESSVASLMQAQDGEARVTLGALEVESLSYPQQIAQFDVTLALIEQDDQLRGSLQYNTDLFDMVDTILSTE